nr:agamous-like MADS-box protein AGL29 [Ipomoea batatas]
MAAYSWFGDCYTKLKAKKEKQMSANRVANEQMVSIPSFANVGAAEFDLNVAAASSNQREFFLCCFEFFLDIDGEQETKHKGRQKIEMKLIECENARSVTFSKRKIILFENAKRAAASTGATIAIFLISSKGYMHAFGTSCVHPIINEYRARHSNDNVAIAVAQNDGHRLDLLNGDPVDKLKQILECQDVSFLLGPNFDRSNLEHPCIDFRPTSDAPPHAHSDLSQPVFLRIAKQVGGNVLVQYHSIPCKIKEDRKGRLQYHIQFSSVFHRLSYWSMHMRPSDLCDSNGVSPIGLYGQSLVPCALNFGIISM